MVSIYRSVREGPFEVLPFQFSGKLSAGLCRDCTVFMLCFLFPFCNVRLSILLISESRTCVALVAGI